MSKKERALSADHWSRFLAGAVMYCAALALPAEAAAATARVRWQPIASGSVTAYEIYVRDGGSTYGTDPQWYGNPAPAADGSLSALVTFTPAASGANYFAVVGVTGSGGESALSGELPTGMPNPCRADSCVTKTACDFSNRTDGTPCDDASFCNGLATCLAGACEAGAPRPEEEIQVDRLRFRNATSGITLAAKGKFVVDPFIDPSQTGAIVELRAANGTVIYSSSIAAASLKAGTSGRRYRFIGRHSESDPLRNGLTRLDFRIKGSRWLVTAKAKTPELMTAFLEPSLTWVIRLGMTCVRHLDVPCEAKSSLSICA